MPEIDKMANRIMEMRHGPQVFDGRTSTCVTMPDWYDRWEVVLKELKTTLRAVDWNRVLLQAQGRHLALGHDYGDYEPCGECVMEALLIEDTFPLWERPQ